jgi:amino acid permease
LSDIVSELVLVTAGNIFTASMHVFCAVVGAGVLALPYSVSWLGWVAGPIMVILFYLFSLLSSRLLASCYEVNGIEHGRYHHVGTVMCESPERAYGSRV